MSVSRFVGSGQPVGEQDGHERDEHDRDRDHVRDRPLARAEQFVEEPDRQRALMSRSEQRHDDLVK